MNELLSQAIEQIRGMWRFRWRALVGAWLIAVLGWAYVYSMPDIYEVETKVYVDTDSALRPLLKGQVVDTNVMSEVELMSRALLSRPRLESVARETDLDLRAKTPQEMEKLIESLRRRIRLERERASGNPIFRLSYTDVQPRMAYNIVNELLSSFVGEAIEGNRGGRDRALQFLKEKLAEYERKLNEAESKLAEFKRANVGRMPGEQGDYYERLQNALNQQSSIEQALRVATERRDLLQRQIDGEEAVFGIVGSPGGGVASSFDPQIAELEAQLEQQLLNWTEKHPSVVALKERLALLYQRRDEELQVRQGMAPSAGAGGGDLALNPVYQELRIQLTSAELDVTSLRARLRQQQTEVAELKAAVDTIPQVEAEYKRLTRDYDSTRENYEDYKQRVERAQTTDEVESGSANVQFRVIEPPLTPIAPIAPDRPLLLSVVLLASLAAGAGVAFLYHQLNPVFGNRNTLGAITQLPVIGSVSLSHTPAERLRLRTQTAMFTLGVLSLLGAWIGSLAFAEQGVELASRLIASTGL